MTDKRMMQSRWPKQTGEDTVAMEDITISPEDHLVVMVDSAPTAHATIMGNYIADRLGVPRDRVTVVAGGRNIHTVNVEDNISGEAP
jgi:hypothetical protein